MSGGNEKQLELFKVHAISADSRLEKPSMQIVMRTIRRALDFLHQLDRTSPGDSRTIRKALLCDAGAPLTPTEQMRVGNIFRSSLFQRQELDVFWIPMQRTITTRLTHLTVKPRFKLPADAVFIGSYRDPCPKADFMADLDDMLRAIRAGCNFYSAGKE